jgi:uncharacterized protein (UPF0212 family)
MKCPVCSDKINVDLDLGTAKCYNCGWKRESIYIKKV